MGADSEINASKWAKAMGPLGDRVTITSPNITITNAATRCILTAKEKVNARELGMHAEVKAQSIRAKTVGANSKLTADKVTVNQLGKNVTIKAETINFTGDVLAADMLGPSSLIKASLTANALGDNVTIESPVINIKNAGHHCTLKGKEVTAEQLDNNVTVEAESIHVTNIGDNCTIKAKEVTVNHLGKNVAIEAETINFTGDVLAANMLPSSLLKASVAANVQGNLGDHVTIESPVINIKNAGHHCTLKGQKVTAEQLDNNVTVEAKFINVTQEVKSGSNLTAKFINVTNVGDNCTIQAKEVTAEQLGNNVTVEATSIHVTKGVKNGSGLTAEFINVQGPIDAKVILNATNIVATGTVHDTATLHTNTVTNKSELDNISHRHVTPNLVIDIVKSSGWVVRNDIVNNKFIIQHGGESSEHDHSSFNKITIVNNHLTFKGDENKPADFNTPFNLNQYEKEQKQKQPRTPVTETIKRDDAIKEEVLQQQPRENAPPPVVNSIKGVKDIGYDKDAIINAATNYRNWSRDNATGMRLSHLFHGENGRENAQNLITKLKDPDITDSDIIKALTDALEKSDNMTHSLSRYLYRTLKGNFAKNDNETKLYKAIQASSSSSAPADTNPQDLEQAQQYLRFDRETLNMSDTEFKAERESLLSTLKAMNDTIPKFEEEVETPSITTTIHG